MPSLSFVRSTVCVMQINHLEIRIKIRKRFIAKFVHTHKEFVLVLGASGTESTNMVQTYKPDSKKVETLYKL